MRYGLWRPGQPHWVSLWTWLIHVFVLVDTIFSLNNLTIPLWIFLSRTSIFWPSCEVEYLSRNYLAPGPISQGLWQGSLRVTPVYAQVYPLVLKAGVTGKHSCLHGSCVSSDLQTILQLSFLSDAALYHFWRDWLLSPIRKHNSLCAY